MNQREKLLGALVGLLGLLMVGYFVWSGVQSAFSRRTATLNRLKEDLQSQDRTLKQAAQATRTLNELQQRSLPTDREKAHSAYQQWLLNLVDQIGFADPSVKVAERRIRNSFYDQSEFDITAEATLDQVTKFLAAFYAAGDLHRVSQLSLTPVPNSRMLELMMEVEAISLPNSQRITVGDINSPDFAEDDVAQHRAHILGRNMFFPANQPPSIGSIGAQQVVQGSPLRVQITATDPDPWDRLTFSLDGEVPDGMELEPGQDNSAELRWNPTATGDFQINLAVSDSGQPQQRAQTSIRVSVVEQPPAGESATDGRRPVLGFDDATQTYLVGTVFRGQRREAWFDIRTKGQLLKLSVGDTLDVGSIIGQITRIDDTLVVLETPFGELRVKVGQSVTEAADVKSPGDSTPSEQSS